MIRFLAVAAASLIAVSTFAQTEPLNAHVVGLPVTVSDASGNPVRGLTVANFALYDEKKKQPITAFDAVDLAATSTASAISPMNPAARRSFVILFDLAFTSPGALLRAQDAARRFVNDIVGPRDLAAVATVDPEQGFRFITALTTDRPLIASAIASPTGFSSHDPLKLANQTVIWNADSNPAAEAAQSPAAQPPAGSNDLVLRQRVGREIDSIGNLARVLRTIPGRKQVVLFSEGFDSRLVPQADPGQSKEQSMMNSQVVDRMADNFRTSDAILEAVDVKLATAVAANTGLFLLTRPTGGEVFRDSSDLHADFDRTLRQRNFVYVLDFHVPDSSPDTFHSVSVRLVNAPDGARITHAPGYFERGRDTPVERALTNAQVIVNDIPENELRLNVLAVAFPPNAAGKPAQVPVIIDINGADLIRETGATIGGADVFVYAFDAAGVVRDRLFDRLTLEVAKVGEKVRQNGVRYYGTLMLPPGSYAVKAFVRTGDPDRGAENAVERRGFGRVNVTVPGEGQIAILPPIPIDDDGKWLVLLANRSENAHDLFEYGGKTFSPTATANLSGGPRKIALFIFGAHPKELTFETRPATKVLGVTEGSGATKVVLQLDRANGASSLDVTVFKKGIAAGQHTSVPLM